MTFPENVSWQNCLEISETPAVDEALRLFAEGETSEDQAVCIVRAVIEEFLKRQASWERVARVQSAKLAAMCNEPGGFEKLRAVMDMYESTKGSEAVGIQSTELTG